MSEQRKNEERVVVLAPSAHDGTVTASILANEGFDVVVVGDGAQLCRAVEAGAAVVLLAEEAFTPTTRKAFGDLLSRQDPWSDLAVILFTGRGARHRRPHTVESLAPLGNVTLLERPVDVITVVSAVRAALRSRRRQYVARASLETARRDEEALREADRQKTAFLAVLSHELRNPLAPIRNSVFLLEKASPGTEAAHRALEVLRRQSDQLARLVDDLLDLNRISHGKIEIRRERLDAREVVTRACADAKELFDDREIDLAFPEPGGPVWVEADAARLSQIVGNLLSNALKFTPPRGSVRAAVEVRNGVCELSVRDTGKGLEPSDLDRVFDPFWQAERTRRGQGGLGLGLALVRELVAQHGGAVRAESAGLGKGSAFFVQLPLAVAPTTLEEARFTVRGSSGLDVLVVEDNEDAATTLADLLVLEGHRVKTVSTGRSAITAIENDRPDVLICDVGLPDLSGHDVIRAIRGRENGRRIYAIALTGYALPEDREAALAAGFDAHLRKPPALEELEVVIAKAEQRRGEHTPAAP